MSPRHYRHGFHSTATCGTLAAAAAKAAGSSSRRFARSPLPEQVGALSREFLRELTC